MCNEKWKSDYINNFLYLYTFRPQQVHHHFSIDSLVGVLRRVTQKRKYIRDEKTQDKLDLRKEESSRSNSQASDAPSRPVLPQQSSTGKWFAYHRNILFLYIIISIIRIYLEIKKLWSFIKIFFTL